MSSNVQCTRASMKSFIRAIRADVISTIRLVIQWRYAKQRSSFPYTWCKDLLFESRFVDPILEIFIRDKASLSEKTSPQLNTNNPKDEEHKEAEQQDITKHGESVQQQHHKNSECKVLLLILKRTGFCLPHAWYSVDCFQRSQHSDCSYCWQVRLLHIHQILQSTIIILFNRMDTRVNLFYPETTMKQSSLFQVSWR